MKNEKTISDYAFDELDKKRLKKSMDSLKKEAEKGDAKAQYNLSSFYFDGYGVTRDYVQAEIWLRRAAKQGFADAMYALGAICYEGKGIAQNYIQAAQWYHKAAEQGSARAQYNLGVMYYEGKGVTQDYRKALKLFYESVKYNFPCAQYAVAVMLFKGLGVMNGIYDKSYRFATYMLYDAIKNDYEKAAKLLSFFENKKIINKGYINNGKEQLKMAMEIFEKKEMLFKLKPCYIELKSSYIEDI